MTKRQVFNRDFKLEAVRLLLEHETEKSADLACELGSNVINYTNVKL